jgi:hypothetical protein
MMQVGDLTEWHGKLYIVVDIEKQTSIHHYQKVTLYCPRTHERYKVPTNLLRR